MLFKLSIVVQNIQSNAGTLSLQGTKVVNRRGKEEGSEEVVNQIQKKVVESYGKYFTQIDYSKFKPEVNPVQIMNMLKWMAEGYLNELRRTNQPIVMEEILAEYKSWSDMFRTIAYKEDRKNE